MAAKDILVPYDFHKNEVRNAVLQVLASAPGSPALGQQYYDSGALQALWWNGTAWTNVATNAAQLNGQSAAYYLSRANHSGTQIAATISDLASTVQAYRLDQFAVPTSAVSLNGQRLTNVATPTAATDAPNRQYVDDRLAGNSWKDEVQASTTANVSITGGGLAAGQVIDGYTLQTGDRVAVLANTAQSENGIYIVPAAGAATRATDADTAAKIFAATFAVMNGTANGGKRYTLTTSGAITLGTTALTFGVFGGGASYSAGNGIAISTNVISAVAGVGVVVDGTGIRVDTAVVPLKYSTTIGDNASTSIVVTHNLGTRDVVARLYSATAPYAEVEADIQHTSTTTVTFAFSIAPTTGQYRAVVMG